MSYLYVPGLECTTSDSLPRSEHAQWLTSSGKPLLPASLLRLWKRESWSRRLSGLTWEPSQLAIFAAAWMQSLPGCPASPTVSPDDVKATPTDGPLGTGTDLLPISSESFESVAPPWSSLRTSQLGLLGDGFDLSAKNYADWVTRSKIRSFSVRQMLARATSGNGSGSSRGTEWQTPKAGEEDSGSGMNSRGEAKLKAQSQQWTTPQAPDEAGGSPDRVRRFGTKHGGANLADDVTNWPTARAEDSESCGNHGAATDSLTGATNRWKTPHGLSSADGGGGEFQKAAELWSTPNASQIETRKQVGAPERENLLGGQAKDWPTPDSRSHHAQGASHNYSMTQLGLAAQLWNTPDTSNANGSREPDGKRSLGLNTEAQSWATPCARIVKGGGETVIRKDGKSRLDQLDYQAEHYSRPDPATPDGPASSPTVRGSRPRLNPAFAAWLMGLPWWLTHPDVTSSVRSAMAASRYVRVLRGASLQLVSCVEYEKL